MLLEAIDGVLDDPRIGEIVISDDASRDDSWDKLWVRFGGNPVFRLLRNEENLDCYTNKRQAVLESSNEWVILFDSDNILDASYLDALFQVDPWEPDTAYLPVFARPEFDYRAFAGLIVTKQNVGRYVDEPMFLTALNTANYVVHRETYLKVWTSDVDPRTADSIFMNFRWLQAGLKLRFVEGMEYEHRIHDGSHFQMNHTHSDELFKRKIELALKVM